MRRRGLLAAGGLVLGLLGCSTPDANARFSGPLPDEGSFAPVAQALVHSCGSLDCHGEPARNLRLVGDEGRRLAPEDRALKPPTTAAEVHENYRSVVSLEPELMSAVFVERGARPERLTIVRKARGTENHKGGALVVAGDDFDVCLTSWLGGATDAAACGRSAKAP